MPRKLPHSDDDVRRLFRTHVRKLLNAGGRDWRALRVRQDAPDVWTFQRPAGGPAWPVAVKLTVDLAGFPAANRLAVDMLVRLLVEQAFFAAASAPLVGADLHADKRRTAGGKTTATDRRKEAAARDLSIGKAANQILAATGPMPDTELADLLAERTGRGAKAIRKKLPKLR